jgi:hypothetical protein
MRHTTTPENNRATIVKAQVATFNPRAAFSNSSFLFMAESLRLNG